MPIKPASVLLCALAILIGGSANALEETAGRVIDPHRIYETQCAGCHAPHARDFVNESLDSVDGRILGSKSRRELRGFLDAGHGNLNPDEIAALVTHLTNILQSGQVFYAKCAICHGRAVRFARAYLHIEDDVLVGRYSGRRIAEFLARHGRLAPAEVPEMLKVLRRQLETAE